VGKENRRPSPVEGEKSLKEDHIPSEAAATPAQPADRSLHVVRRLRRAFLSICRCGDVMFSPYRLTTEQYSLMLAVFRNPGIRQVDVQDRIFAEPNTVTAMVSLLERRGILRRKSSPSDGRVRLLYLTAHGQAVMKRLSDDWAPMRALLQKCFSGKGGQEALEILDKVYSEMDRERDNLLKKVYTDHPLDRDVEMEREDGRPALNSGRERSNHTNPSVARPHKKIKLRSRVKQPES
jgi:DNA-binding MarR family transcriptional regulator